MGTLNLRLLLIFYTGAKCEDTARSAVDSPSSD